MDIGYKIDRNSALAMLFNAAFGVSPTYIVPIGQPVPPVVSGYMPSMNETVDYETIEQMSIYNTPIIFPVTFNGGNYKVYNQRGQIETKEFPQLLLPGTTMVDFSRAKNIIKTNTLGSNGTVKEIFSFDDWQIRLRIICMKDRADADTAQYVEDILSFNQIIESISVTGSLFVKKEIHRITVENIDIRSLIGQPNVVPIEITATSDEAIELILTPEKT